jgi:hypothetical protein
VASQALLCPGCVGPVVLKEFDATLGFPGEGPIDPGTPLGGERRVRPRTQSSPPQVNVATLPRSVAGTLAETMRQLTFDESMAPTRSARIFCPVPGCLCADRVRSQGWASDATMRNHLQDHASGRLLGVVPQEYLQEKRLCQCSVCFKLVSSRFGGSCPSCRPAAREALGTNSDQAGQPRNRSLPELGAVMSAPFPTLRRVPTGAKAVWAQCLSQALAKAVWENSLDAWTELAMLPKAVLTPGPRR